MEIREEFLWGYAEKLEEDAATALAYAMEELENSKNPEIHVYVADALMALDDYEGAVEEINEALEKNIVNVNYAKSLKGEALFYLERYEESKKVFTEILDSNPNSFFVVAYLTDIDIKLGKYEEGIARAEINEYWNGIDDFLENSGYGRDFIDMESFTQSLFNYDYIYIDGYVFRNN